MIFSSTVFLFFFLPLSLVLYGITPRLFKNATLLIISLMFYYYGEVDKIIVLLVSILINYVGGILVAYPFKNSVIKTKHFNLFWLIIAIILNLLILGYFKYYNFFLENTYLFVNLFRSENSQLIYTVKKISMPLGISFYTFQAMSYVIDAYRKSVKINYNPLNMATYITMFPQLVAGPIVRYIDINKEMVCRKYSLENLNEGFIRFSMGISKKVLLADSLGVICDRIFALDNSNLTFTVAWIAMICYTMQIYFDFSGYSDMAIGLGKMFGFNFPENFNYPYISRSVQEFWRRWHMTLSSWFKDYLYIPLGGNRKGKLRTYINLLIVFSICGFWHGAEWVFLIWGLWHGAFLVLERTKFGEVLHRFPKPLQHFYTILVFVFGWVWFKSSSFAQAISFLKAMSGFSTNNVQCAKAVPNYTLSYIFILICIAICCSTPILPYIKNKRIPNSFFYQTIRIGICIVCLIFVSIILLINNDNSPFLYFRF